MSKKHTDEYVRQCFRDGGCEWLGNEYKNSRTKLKYRCSCGNEAEITFDSFQHGHRCIKCSGKEKHTIEQAKQIYKDGGCILLEDKYINSHIPMRYICECGNESTTSLSCFQSGHRCAKCGGNEKHTNEYIQQYYKDRGCKVLDKYVNNSIPMRFICECGKESKTNFNNFKNGVRCKECGRQKTINGLKHSNEYIKKFFRDRKCEWLGDEYINNHTLMEFRCECGNESEITLRCFQRGQRCAKCGIEKISGKNSTNYNNDITDEEREIGRAYPEYREWRTAVYERDNYTCQKCKEQESVWGNLNAHHIEPYAKNKELRTDVNNGITFCKDCHKNFHHRYGFDCDSEQLQEFLKDV